MYYISVKMLISSNKILNTYSDYIRKIMKENDYAIEKIIDNDMCHLTHIIFRDSNDKFIKFTFLEQEFYHQYQ